MSNAAFWLALVTLAWGVLAFGAVYAWAFVPLASGAVVAGLLALADGREGVPRGLVLACVALLASLALQLVPLPAGVLETVSPAAVTALNQLDVAFATGVTQSHALSIHPPATARALLLGAAWLVFLAGTTSLFSRAGAERFASLLAGLAVTVSFIGIIQASTGSAKIYGVWTSEQGGTPFGPFVNRNHFAGWILMLLPLTLGLFCMGVSRGMRGVKPRFLDRLIWFTSRDASKIIMHGMAACVMMLALMLTSSRSGMIAGAGTIFLTGLVFLKSDAPSSRKMVVMAFLVTMTAGVIAVVGPDVIGRRWVGEDAGNVKGRLGVWADASNVARQFPITGSGINTYGTAMLIHQRHHTERHFSAAHNGYLQIAAEGGVLVGVPAVIALIVLWAGIRRRLREDRGSSYYWLRGGAAASLVAIGLQEAVDFSLQMPGNAVMFAAICGIAIHKRPSRRDIVAPAP